MPITTSLFDALEDTDTDKCLALSTLLAGPKATCPVNEYTLLAFGLGIVVGMVSLKYLK